MGKYNMDANAGGASMVGSSAGALHSSYNATTHNDDNDKKPVVVTTPVGVGTATTAVEPAEVKGKAPSGLFNAVTGAITPAIPL